MSNKTLAKFRNKYIEDVEEWRAIADFLGYEVSNWGRVRSYWTRGNNAHIANIYQRISGQKLGKNGYMQVTLFKDGVRYTKTVHSLVAEAFLGPCPEGQEICHKEKGRLDNSVANLEYGTKSKNQGIDRLRDGTDNRGEKSGMAKITEEIVKEIRSIEFPPNGHGTCRCHKGWITRKDIAKKYNITPTQVGRIASGKSWKYT